jgi:hypothetical protein
VTRRLFYIALGATAGVLLVRKLSETAQRLTPGSMVGELSAAIRDFGHEVRAGMAEREEELRDALYGDGEL